MPAIIYKGQSKSGKPYQIRQVAGSDVPGLCDYINALSKENTFITHQGEAVTLDQEISYVNNQLQGIEAHNIVSLVAVSSGQIIGHATITRQNRVKDHIGLLGITLHKEFRGEGIGRKLLETAIDQAIQHLDGLRLIRLAVFANNPVARSLYESVGFIEYGRLPKGVRYRDQFVDYIMMYKEITKTKSGHRSE